jgi:hypothetical protein
MLATYIPSGNHAALAIIATISHLTRCMVPLAHPTMAARGVGLRTTRRQVGATGRGGAFTSPTTMVVAEGAGASRLVRPSP